MSIFSTRITVGTAVVTLVEPSVQHQQVQLLNAGTAVVRIGGPDVTTTAYGLPALPDNPNVARTPFSFRLNPNESIHALTADGTSNVNVWIQRP
jgi:hypothetical protein